MPSRCGGFSRFPTGAIAVDGIGCPGGLACKMRQSFSAARTADERASLAPAALTHEGGSHACLEQEAGQLALGKGVRITIVKIDSNSVRIGIDAPEHVSIQRQEITSISPSHSRERPPSNASLCCRILLQATYCL